MESLEITVGYRSDAGWEETAILRLPSDGDRPAEATANQFSAACIEDQPAPFVTRYRLRIRNDGALRDVRVGVRWRVPTSRPPRWLVPGMFYGENRPRDSLRRYPRFAADPGPEEDRFTASAWEFRGDRLPVPAVLALVAGRGWIGLATPAEGPYGQAGVAFGLDVGASLAWIGLNVPYVESPVAYTIGVREPAYEAQTVRLAAGDRLAVTFYAFAGEAGEHSYDPFVRFLYGQLARDAPLNPWVGVETAAELAAYGLYRWHYDPADRALYETIAFDREGYDGDRRHMHVGWVSGAPYAYALYRHAERTRNGAYRDAAIQVLDHIAEGMAPAGILYGEWTREGGFGPGWTGESGAVHTRTIGEAVWFLLRTFVAERAAGVRHPAWERVVRAHLAFLAEIEQDGNLGTYYDPRQRGRVLRWDGSGGLIWIPVLLEAAEAFGEPRWRAMAERAGRFYAAAVRTGDLYGAPEDVDRSPSSEDGYNAIIAYVHLYEATERREWLRLAQMSAAWTMTFRWTHNLRFSPETILGAYDFRTRGADLASPANNHLHSYGLIALPECLRLAEYGHDPYLRARTRDHLACFLQFVARRDGDFNALRGMVGERYYQTDWAQPKGKILGLSHAWCVGLLLYAAEYLLQNGVELDLEGASDGW